MEGHINSLMHMSPFPCPHVWLCLLYVALSQVPRLVLVLIPYPQTYFSHRIVTLLFRREGEEGIVSGAAVREGEGGGECPGHSPSRDATTHCPVGGASARDGGTLLDRQRQAQTGAIKTKWKSKAGRRGGRQAGGQEDEWNG